MTNKEAISNLERIYGIVSSDIQISLDLAIKALEQEENLEQADIYDELESQARWICCPMCDRERCNRNADDCDAKKWIEEKKND